MAAKVRAYKLAEELGIDRNEFVERAAAEGVELKSPMAALEPEQVDLLREKLGAPSSDKTRVDEHRVEGKAGSTILRRRKKVVKPAPEPAKPEPVVLESVGSAAPEADEEELSSEPALEAEGPTSEPAGEEPAAPVAPARAPAVTEEPGASPVRKRAATVGEEPPDRKGKQRKRVREVVNLREQEQVKLQYAGRGVVRRRPPVVAPRAVQNPRSRRRDKLEQARRRRAGQRAGEADQDGPRAGRDQRRRAREAARRQGARHPGQADGPRHHGLRQPDDRRRDRRQGGGRLGFEVQDVGFKEEEFFEGTGGPGEEEMAKALEPRPPVITVMGHVDHGKTSMLDAIRKTNVVSGEAGGITQHIGAYQVSVGASKLTFIDTPGHAAFTAMRARGAAVTDLVVLVVAATEGVMPQTVEAIQHAQAAGCPIVVAVNKCDLPDADPRADAPAPDGARPRLRGVRWRDDLRERVGQDGRGARAAARDAPLQAEVLELRADPDLRARRRRPRGASSTRDEVRWRRCSSRRARCSNGDVVVCGTEWGRVRTMENDKGERVKEAGPSVPVQVMGLSGVPNAGAALQRRRERTRRQADRRPPRGPGALAPGRRGAEAHPRGVLRPRRRRRAEGAPRRPEGGRPGDLRGREATPSRRCRPTRSA